MIIGIAREIIYNAYVFSDRAIEGICLAGKPTRRTLQQFTIYYTRLEINVLLVLKLIEYSLVICSFSSK